jgi:SHS2 domain-containing protein
MDRGYIPLELIDHTADMGIIARGRSLKSLFSNAALGLMQLIVFNTDEKGTEIMPVRIEGCDQTDLFVKWLGEILYLLQGEDMVTVDVRLKTLSTVKLEAEVIATGFDPGRHNVKLDVKAVTYHQSMVWNDGTLWMGRVILDL